MYGVGLAAPRLGVVGVLGRDPNASDETFLLGVCGLEFELVRVRVICFASVDSAALYCFVFVEFSAPWAASVKRATVSCTLDVEPLG